MPQPPNAFLKYTNMAFQLAIPIALGAWGGSKLDEHYKNTTPIFTAILSIVGVAAGLYLALKDFIKPKN